MQTGTRDEEISLNDLLDSQKIGPYQLFVVALCCLVMVIDGYDLFMVAMTVPKIADSFGVAPAALAPVMAIQNLGLAIGTAVIGLYSDRIGRKKTLCYSIAAFSVFTALSMLATDLTTFAVARLLTCAFLAGVIPNVIALTNEMTPARYRQGFVSLVYAGYAIGAGLASLTAGSIFSDASWHAIFATATAAGGLSLLLVLFFLPESVRFLADTEGGHDRALRQLRKMVPNVRIDIEALRQGARQATHVGWPSPARLFDGKRKGLTLLMWAAFGLSFMSLSSFAALGPVILNLTVQLPLHTAGSLMMVYSLGGLAGTTISGFVLDRWGARLGLCFWYGAATAGWLLMAITVDGGLLGHFAILMAGIGMMGAQGALNAFLPTVYPTGIRATGVGWAFGIGRLAGIAAPILFVGFVAAPGLQELYFLLLALPTTLVVLVAPLLVRSSVVAGNQAAPARQETPSAGERTALERNG